MVNNTGSFYLAQGTALGTQVGNYATGVALPNGFTNATRVVTGDLNADGRPDVLSAGSKLFFYPNQNTATFANIFTTATATQIELSAIDPVVRLLVADATGDRVRDIVATTSSRVVVVAGNGAGSFTSQTAVPIPANYSASSTAVADFNGDGLPDLVVAATGSGGAANNVLLIFPGTGLSGGNPTFGGAQVIQIGSNPRPT